MWYGREPADDRERAYYDELAERHYPVSVLARPGDEECGVCGRRFVAGEDVMVSMPDGSFAHEDCLAGAA
jgi:hypothetical protein